ncbi:MAG: 50S ribosomal protein L13 [Thermoproteota archaeon]
MRKVSRQPTIIDGEHLIMGRMASLIAKKLMEGERIKVVNAEKVVISGNKKRKVQEMKKYLEVGHPTKGPFHYRAPDRILRRTVRGMLPYKKTKGKRAYKNLKVFIGVPEELKDSMTETLAEAHAKKLSCPYFTLGELAKEIGWNPGGSYA